MSILLDTGSTHNFIYPSVLHRTGLQVRPETSFKVTIRGGDTLHSAGKCEKVQVLCQVVTITTDFHILHIGGYQMVLGVEWLQTLDELTLNFQSQRMRLTKEGKAWEFKGIEAKAMELVPAKMMDKSVLQNAKGWVLYIYHKDDEVKTCWDTISHPQLKDLYQEFSELFKEKLGLPPRRSHDHDINLLPGPYPVNLKPYQHPWE